MAWACGWVAPETPGVGRLTRLTHWDGRKFSEEVEVHLNLLAFVWKVGESADPDFVGTESRWASWACPHAVAQSPEFRRGLSLVSCSVVTILKFLIIFEQRAHFILPLTLQIM